MDAHVCCRVSNYFSNVLNTCRLCANVDFAHSCWALAAFAIVRSMPSGVDGFTSPSS